VLRHIPSPFSARCRFYLILRGVNSNNSSDRKQRETSVGGLKAVCNYLKWLYLHCPRHILVADWPASRTANNLPPTPPARRAICCLTSALVLYSRVLCEAAAAERAGEQHTGSHCTASRRTTHEESLQGGQENNSHTGSRCTASRRTNLTRGVAAKRAGEQHSHSWQENKSHTGSRCRAGRRITHGNVSVYYEQQQDSNLSFNTWEVAVRRAGKQQSYGESLQSGRRATHG
jgi:hypothetical protein